MKAKLTLVLFFTVLLISKAQDQVVVSKGANQQNIISGSFSSFIKGNTVDVQYESVYINSQFPNWKSGIRLNAGMVHIEDVYNSDWLGNLGAQFFVYHGKQRKHVELGLGLTSVISKRVKEMPVDYYDPYTHHEIEGSYDFYFLPKVNVGYRGESRDKRLVFRWGLTFPYGMYWSWGYKF
jgi:hypothetical protein